jgi:cellulose synthase (UDP-forming)
VLFTLAQVIEIRQLGQRKRDVISLYALNLLLVPINLSGMWHSLKQLATGQRGSFGRTPKVVRRTSVPRHHVIAPLMLLAAFTGKIGYYFLVSQSWPGVVGAASLGLIMLYGLSRFMGWSHILADLAVQHDVLRGNPQCALRQVASLVLLREAASQSEGVS